LTRRSSVGSRRSAIASPGIVATINARVELTH
jgi:hypothetical protein